MRIPNPFMLILRVMFWPFLQGFVLLLHSVRFQKWWLRTFVKMGTPESVLTSMAVQLNAFNHDHGIEAATYVIAQNQPVESTTSDEEKPSGEAKP